MHVCVVCDVWGWGWVRETHHTRLQNGTRDRQCKSQLGLGGVPLSLGVKIDLECFRVLVDHRTLTPRSRLHQMLKMQTQKGI